MTHTTIAAADALAARDTSWNAWALAPSHVVGGAMGWSFLRWMLPALDPTHDATRALAGFAAAAVLATVGAAVVGVRIARIADRRSAAWHGAFSGAIAAGWLAAPVMMVLPLRAAFSPAQSAPDRLLTQDEVGVWLASQMLRMFHASNAAMVCAAALLIVASFAAAVGRSALGDPPRPSGQVRDPAVLLAAWSLLVMSAISVIGTFVALGGLETAMMENLAHLSVATVLGLNGLEQFMVAQLLVFAAAVVGVASLLRAGSRDDREARARRVVTAALTLLALGGIALAVGTLDLQRPVWIALGVISAATLVMVVVRARQGAPPDEAGGPPTLGALLLFALSARVVVGSIPQANVGYGVAASRSSVAWIVPLSKDASAPRPSWSSALEASLHTIESPLQVVLGALVLGLTWWAAQRVATRVATRAVEARP